MTQLQMMKNQLKLYRGAFWEHILWAAIDAALVGLTTWRFFTLTGVWGSWAFLLLAVVLVITAVKEISRAVTFYKDVKYYKGQVERLETLELVNAMSLGAKTVVDETGIYSVDKDGNRHSIGYLVDAEKIKERNRKQLQDKTEQK